MVYSTIKVMKYQGKTKMRCSALNDLFLAGVRWELTDVPLVRANIAVRPQASVQSSDGSGRTVMRAVPPIAPVSPITVEMAMSMATRPADIESLNRMVGEFKHPLRSSATNTVGIHIAANPNGMIILTDIPSADDDASGNILSGASGEMMDKMLGAIGMSRENVSILPRLFWRTPGGRTPSREEMDLARPFINRAIELLKPRVILTLGTLPATEIAGINLGRSHGVPVTLENGTTVMPIYHPNYLTLKPAAKRDVWNALQNVQNLLKSA